MAAIKENTISLKDKAATEKRHWVRLTHSCNNRCLFCLDAERLDGSFLPFLNISNDLRAGRKKGYLRLVLSGGEPTIHPDFLDIISLAKKVGYNHIQVITNGRMFSYNGFIRKAAMNGLDEVTFSMHGHTASLHETLTQAKGSFAQACKGLANAISIRKLIVSVDIVINRANVKELKNILEFYINLGVKEFDLLQVIPFGRAWNNWDRLGYDMGKNHSYLNKAFLLSKNKGLVLWTNRFPAQFLEGFEDLIQHPDKLYDEVRGRESLFQGFIKAGGKIACFGSRCAFCVLRDFCNDLAELKKQGKLFCKKNPVCLKGNLSPRKDRVLYFGKGIDIFTFLDFFIENRYFVKSLRCNACCFRRGCDGAPINYLREYGFKALTPLPDRGATVFLSIPDGCGLKCIFCSRLTSNVEEDKRGFDYEKNKKILQQARRDFRYKIVQIGGTEPLNYAGLAGLVRYARAIGFEKISIQTSGIKLSDQGYLGALVKAGANEFMLPIYGYTAKEHDFIVGKAGSFIKLINAIDNLRSINQGIRLHTIFLKQNYMDLGGLFSFVRDRLKISFEQFNIEFVRPGNNDLAEYEKLCPRYSDIVNQLLVILPRYSRRDIEVLRERIELPFCLLVKIFRNFFNFSSLLSFYENKSDLSFALKAHNNEIFYGDFPDTDLGSDLGGLSGKCKRCVFVNKCNRCPGHYIKIYGDSELKPFV